MDRSVIDSKKHIITNTRKNEKEAFVTTSFSAQWEELPCPSVMQVYKNILKPIQKNCTY